MDILSTVTEPLVIEEEVFVLWLSGYTIEQSTDHRYKADSTCSDFSRDVVRCDTEDQFQTFELMEPLFRKPGILASSPLFNIGKTVDNLLQQYYSLDAIVARELVGRKIGAKLRKDLDSIHEITRVPLKSCYRQYDNIRRIYKEVDEKEGKVTRNIQRFFGVNTALAQQYAATIFIMDNRIDVSPKKLPNLTFDSLVKCVSQIMKEWCPPGDVQSDIDVDRGFLRELHELNDRVPETGMQAVINLSVETIKARKDMPPQTVCEMKKLIRRLMQIGTDLVHTKDFRDIFIDVEEKALEGWREADLSSVHLEATLSAFVSSFSTVAATKGFTLTIPTLEKYMKTVSICLLLML